MNRRCTSTVGWITLGLVLGVASETTAAPPTNDICSRAVALTLDIPTGGTTVDAKNDYQVSDSGCFGGPGGAFSGASGSDAVYSFTAPSAGNYSIRVTGYAATANLVLHVSTTCLGGPAPIFLPNCIGAANRIGAGVDAAAEEVPCLLLNSGQTLFAVVDEDALTLGSPFSIEVNRCTLEDASNDTTGTADPLTCGGQGFLSPGTDADFVALGINPVGSRLFAMVDAVAATTANFDLRVTTSDNTLEYDDGDNVAFFGATAPNVAGVPLTSFAAFLRISHFSQAASGPYRYYSVLQPPAASAIPEIEPNGGIASANTSAVNYFSGQLGGAAPSTDVDVYGFGATAGDLLYLSLDANPLRDNTPIDAALALLDSAGTTLVLVNDQNSLSSSSSGDNSLISFTPASPAEALLFRVPQTGNYYAQVFIGTSASSAIGAGDYLLSIARSCVAGGGGFLPTPTVPPTATATATTTQTATATPIPLSSGSSPTRGLALGFGLFALILVRRRTRPA